MMNEKRKIIEQYINGWKENDANKIISTLTNDCEIIESHGSRYRGIDEVRKWVDNWIKLENKVIEWKIISFYEIEDICFFEWFFECFSEGKMHKLEGISVIKFKNEFIYFIREYKSTKN